MNSTAATSTQDLEGAGGGLDEVRRLLHEEIARHGLSQTRVSEESGVSTTAISRFLNGRYEGNNSQVATDLKKWLDARKQRALLTDGLPEVPEWFETSVTKKIHATLAYSQHFAKFVCIYGPPGIGKTTGLRRYGEDHPNVWIVQVKRFAADLTSLLETIGFEVLGLKDVPRRQSDMGKAICQKVRGTRGLLVIDEAQHCPRAALEGIRGLFDCTHEHRGQGIGIALCGNEMVYANLRGNNHVAYAQLFSRVAKRTYLSEITPEDVDALCKAWGIQGKEERSLLGKLATSLGTLRTATQVLEQAAVLASDGGGKIAKEHLLAAAGDLEVARE